MKLGDELRLVDLLFRVAPRVVRVEQSGVEQKVLFDGFERVDLDRPLRPERHAEQCVGLRLDDADRGQGGAPHRPGVALDLHDELLRLDDDRGSAGQLRLRCVDALAGPR